MPRGKRTEVLDRKEHVDLEKYEHEHCEHLYKKKIYCNTWEHVLSPVLLKLKVSRGYSEFKSKTVYG